MAMPGRVTYVTEPPLLPGPLRERTSFVLIRLANLLRQECADKLGTLGLSQHQHAILLVTGDGRKALHRAEELFEDVDGSVLAHLDAGQRAELTRLARTVLIAHAPQNWTAGA
jgi:hypothetical protein